MIGVSAGPILPAFGPVPTAVDMAVGLLRHKHDYKKKKKKKKNKTIYTFPYIIELNAPADPI